MTGLEHGTHPSPTFSEGPLDLGNHRSGAKCSKGPKRSQHQICFNGRSSSGIDRSEPRRLVLGLGLGCGVLVRASGGSSYTWKKEVPGSSKIKVGHDPSTVPSTTWYDCILMFVFGTEVGSDPPGSDTNTNTSSHSSTTSHRLVANTTALCLSIAAARHLLL